MMSDQLAIEPTSLPVSSFTYSDQVPLAGLPLKTSSVEPHGPAGAGAAKEGGAYAGLLVGENRPPRSLRLVGERGGSEREAGDERKGDRRERAHKNLLLRPRPPPIPSRSPGPMRRAGPRGLMPED